ncbi:PREDICTED: uncharacterized protein LOC109469096 [Branchiostoma belcheri]|uniref:Uncharacterized protein LOC109469096 n=1 Tax=Branchiostoma belcheri TaxID=7741 RepID=A0A6P4YF24_BRABE|nr:PREDICTED: uncharacterized protein LOC109469096 [Branchiostoma belcheri]
MIGLLRYMLHVYLFLVGAHLFNRSWDYALDKQWVPRDGLVVKYLSDFSEFETTPEQLIYPVANAEIFVRAYVRPANETHYSRLTQCELYKGVHRDTMVRRLTSGGKDPGRVNIEAARYSWTFSYLVRSCFRLRQPSEDFDVPPEEPPPPYIPITWLQLARNIRDWTTDYLREASSEDPTDSYTGPGPRPKKWSEFFQETFKSMTAWISSDDENELDAANAPPHPATNTDPPEVTWSHLWGEICKKASSDVRAIFWSDTPDDVVMTQDDAPKTDPADPEPNGGVWAALMNRLPSSPTTHDETPDPGGQEDSTEPGWSVPAWIGRIFQAKKPMTAQIRADAPVIIDDPP